MLAYSYNVKFSQNLLDRTKVYRIALLADSKNVVFVSKIQFWCQCVHNYSELVMYMDGNIFQVFCIHNFLVSSTLVDDYMGLTLLRLYYLARQCSVPVLCTRQG